VTPEDRTVLTGIIIAFHVLFSSLLVLFILLHRGTGGGLSDMFGGGGGMGNLQGSAVVERNLDRLTVAVAIGFTVTNVLLVVRL
jgi:preprotein translocase subunit SecG